MESPHGIPTSLSGHSSIQLPMASPICSQCYTICCHRHVPYILRLMHFCSPHLLRLLHLCLDNCAIRTSGQLISHWLHSRQCQKKKKMKEQKDRKGLKPLPD